MKATVLWGSNELECRVFDLSASGLCVAVPAAHAEEAETIRGLERLRLRFRLPNGETVHQGRAFVKHAADLVNQTLIGLQFDLEQEDGIRRHAEELRGWVLRKAEEIEAWERAIRVA